MCKVISVVMEKGGVGKTTTCIHIGDALARQNKKVLLLDFDPQGNIAISFRIDKTTLEWTISDLVSCFLDTGKVRDFDRTRIDINENLSIIPSNRMLAGVQNRLIIEKTNQSFLSGNSVSSEMVLKRILDIIGESFDFIIIDTPPSLSMLTISTITASDYVLLPCQAQFYSLENIVDSLETVTLVKKNLNPELKVAGILVTMDQGYNLNKRVIEEVGIRYGKNFFTFENSIPYAIKMAEQPAFGVTMHEINPSSKVAEAYMSVSKELINNVF